MLSIRRAGALALSLCATAAALAPASAATARPASGPAASRVLLSVVPVEQGSNPERLAVLECDPDGGTHTRAASACDQLRAVGGDLQALADDSSICTREYRPVTATAIGVWRGSPLSYRVTFSNRCLLLSATGDVFNF